MLEKASSLKEEAHQLEDMVQHLEMEGLGKVEAAVAGSEAEGLYGLLRGAISHPSISSAPPPPKKACHIPSTTVSHPPPQEPYRCYTQSLQSCNKDCRTGIRNCLSSFRGSSPCQHATPSHSIGGTKRVTDAGLKVARGTINLTHHNLHTCVQSAPGGGIGVSSCVKSFFNPDIF